MLRSIRKTSILSVFVGFLGCSSTQDVVEDLCNKSSQCDFLPSGVSQNACFDQITTCSSRLADQDRGNWQDWAAHCLEKATCEDFAQCYYSKNTCVPAAVVEEPEDPEQDAPDNLCHASDAYECHDDSLIKCVDGRWLPEPCQDICTSNNFDYSVRCEYDEAEQHDLCVCGFNIECSDDEEYDQRCGGDHYLLRCLDNEWVVKDCYKVCLDDPEYPYFTECKVDPKDGLEKCTCSNLPPD